MLRASSVSMTERFLLADVLAAARTQPGGVVVFDLDSTLLDNRPRQARIFREFGQQHGVSELQTAEPGHWLGWDLRVPMRNLGLSPERIAELYPALRRFWHERFFTSEYCREDVPIPGAAAFARSVATAGAHVVYLTGRHEGMRAGTIEVFARYGFPLPQQPGDVTLLMKPMLLEDDDAFKAAAHARVRALGWVVAAFDNEPAHANDLARSFPGARVVHVATDHSGRDIALLPGIPSLPDFERPLASVTAGDSA
jgi:hypothetical protein